MEIKTVLLTMLIAISSVTAAADVTVYSCRDQRIEIVDKEVSGDRGERIKLGRYMFVFGDLVTELQSLGLYPAAMIPGANPQGLYWNQVVTFESGDFGALVKAGIQGPLFHYYLKPGENNSALLEVWQLEEFRPIGAGVGNGQLVYEREMPNCY